MATVITKGKVSSYNINTGQIVCQRSGVFIWRGTTVRTSGSHASICNPTTTFTFDVTVSLATAQLLVPGFEFVLEYDDGGGSTTKRVTKFAGEVIPPQTAGFNATPATNSPSSPPPSP